MEFQIYLRIAYLLEIIKSITLTQALKHKGLHFKIDEESPVNIDIGSIQPMNCGGPNEMMQGSTVKFHFVSESSRILSYIVINQSTGRLSVSRPIDRDSLCEKMKLCCVDLVQTPDCIIQFKAMVELFDSQGSTISMKDCNVLIEIVDINDHSPTFAVEKVIINISESAAIDSSYSLPIAHDLDSSKFSVSRYYFHEASRYFRIEYNPDNSGKIIPKIVVKSRLDREEISEHHLTVVAVDAGIPPKSGRLNVVINVLDENDNTPIIEQLAPIYVKEDIMVGHHITKIEAKDKDSGENQLLSYFLKESLIPSELSHFKINQMTGAIVLVKSIDYDTMQSLPQIELIITVQDHGKPKQLSSSVTLTIMVEDVNDEIPIISIIDIYSRQPAKPEILENLQPNQFVAFVNVHDADNGVNGQVKCELVGHEDDFNLENVEYNNVKDRYEYKIVTKTKLDCEKYSMYRLIVRCSDFGHPRQSSQQDLIVKVIDVNDNSPTFGKSRIELEIAENEAPGTLLTTINVTDLDETDREHGRFDFSISESGSKLFRIEPVEGRDKTENSKLKIYTLISFDREKVSVLEFEITVSNTNWSTSTGVWRSLSSTSSVVVNIKDKNDNGPVFSKTHYEFSIMEEKPHNLFVGLLQASDEDKGDNGKILYKIEDFSSELQNSFNLDLNSGSLTTKSKIDREKTPIFEFKVKARDLGHPSKFSVAQVVVKVNDINDNDPKFIYPTSDNHTVTASVFSSEASLIMKVNAVDIDEAGKNQIMYSIENGDPNNLFQIDANLGGISFAKKPKPSEAHSYFLTIKVTDNDFPIRSAQITIHLKLESSRLQYSNDYMNSKQNGLSDDISWMENPDSNKMNINRNILLIICLIIISAALAGVLLMLILCLKKRPSGSLRKHDLSDSASRKTVITSPNSCSLYFDSNNKAMKTNCFHESNVSLNYRMALKKSKNILNDSNQNSYLGLPLCRKINNLCGYNADHSINLINNNHCDNYYPSPDHSQMSKSGENIYQKISATIEMPKSLGIKQINDNVALTSFDDTPNFFSSYDNAEQQFEESQSKALNNRYQTLNASARSNVICIDAIDNIYSDSINATVDTVATPKKSFIASSFV